MFAKNCISVYHLFSEQWLGLCEHPVLMQLLMVHTTNNIKIKEI